jgi:hypothetical protein
MSFTTRQARSELDKLERKLKGYEALLMRKQQLETFLSLAEKLSSKPKAKLPVTASLEPVKMKRPLRTSDVAAQVLQRHRELHLSNLHQQMHALGWTGSGNVENEKKAIYVAMLRDSRFQKVGRNVWALRQIEAKAAS